MTTALFLLLIGVAVAHAQTDLQKIVSDNEKALTQFRKKNAIMKAKLRKNKACVEARRILRELPSDSEKETRFQAKKDVHSLCRKQ